MGIGKLIVITGETAAGKDTVTANLLSLHPDWKKIITTTTRNPREGEINHIDHDFISKDEFLKLKSQEGFLESIEYAGNYYGTPKKALDPLLTGTNLIWRIDISMAAKVEGWLKNAFPKSVAGKIKKNTRVIFIKLQDNTTQCQRLIERGMSKAEISSRIEQDNKNLKSGNFKNIVINYNGKLEETVKKVEGIINS